jgi:hypothetical protein
MTTEQIAALSAITLVAAAVNGALGYGFSSITVPLTLLFLSNRVLNPALVLIEVVLNAYVLVVSRKSVRTVWRRMLPVLLGLAPGIAVGTMLVSTLSVHWMKLWTFALLIPVILLQAAGYRRPVRSERGAGLVFGGGLGALYAVTTISGPPLAVMLGNQGFTKRDFRAALSLVRLVTSSVTAAAFLSVGMVTATSLGLAALILPSLAIGVPIGVLLVRRVPADAFRRMCLSVNAWIAAFGLVSVLRLLDLVDTLTASALFAAVAGFDTVLLFRFFQRGHAAGRPSIPMPVSSS